MTRISFDYPFEQVRFLIFNNNPTPFYVIFFKTPKGCYYYSIWKFILIKTLKRVTLLKQSKVTNTAYRWHYWGVIRLSIQTKIFHCLPPEIIDLRTSELVHSFFGWSYHISLMSSITLSVYNSRSHLFRSGQNQQWHFNALTPKIYHKPFAFWKDWHIFNLNEHGWPIKKNNSNWLYVTL